MFWLAAWIVPVVVLFNKGQTAWAVTGILFGWAIPLIWIVVAIATQNQNRLSADERRHLETLNAISHSTPSLVIEEQKPGIDDRPATLDRLLSEGKISPEEHAEQRREILREI
jgi:membrane protein required for beta-lactamase induction